MILPLEYVQKCELSLVKKGVEIWNVIEDFFVKIEELSIEGVWHSFSLVMYGFCSNSALYSASLSCIIFILLTSFISKIITISFQSNRSLVMLIEKILTKKKKAFNVVLMPSKHEKITFPHEFVFVHMSFK